jgi:uncharacterized protein with ParB-like and HNH nuclease domain/predicted transport protein
MKASEAKLLDFLKKSSQFVIPIYQRTYSWTEKECRQLWDDVVRAGSDGLVLVHFIGSIVYVEKGLSQVTQHASLLVIDGQQRLTTVMLLLTALANAVAKSLGDGEPLDGFSARKIRNYYLLNPEEVGERRYKLLLSQTDKHSLTSLVGNTEPPAETSLRVVHNFKLFEKLIGECHGDLTAICRGLAKLVVVDIALSRDQDNPQLIFESMNSTGRELSQADLIRNFILMGLEPDLQTRLYEQFWRPMEVAFGQEAYGTHFDGFMRHYLTVKTGQVPNFGDVYEAFKQHARTPPIAAAGVESLVKDVRDFARYFCAMALGQESDLNLKAAFNDLRELRVDVAYPFLLELYQDHAAGRLSYADFLAAVRIVESYVFRRAICAIPTNSMNKTFATFSKALRKDRYLESIQAHFLRLPSYRRIPKDEEFVRELKTRDLYNFRNHGYWLRRLENHDRRERVHITEYSIEHILPQNENLSEAWQTALGPDWKQVQRQWLHTIGNLTLSAYNSEYSDRPFQEKRDMPNGFRDSPLRMNIGLGQVAEWNEAAIMVRAERLAKMAADVWALPALPADVLASYQPNASRGERTTAYTLEDHPHLRGGETRLLFEALRREVLALNPCVAEEVLKLYIAFKAETNFVDVVPQARRLLLSLNMPFSEVIDPEGVCKDITALGRLGNGDVEVGLTSIGEVPYVMSLVRQSFERQMGGGSDR